MSLELGIVAFFLKRMDIKNLIYLSKSKNESRNFTKRKQLCKYELIEFIDIKPFRGDCKIKISISETRVEHERAVIYVSYIYILKVYCQKT